MTASRSSRRFLARLPVQAAALLLAASLLTPVSRAEGVARFSVGAEVQPRASIRTLSGQRELNISADDIARGSIEIPSAMEVEIRSNTPAGYVLDVQPLIAMFTRAQIVGLNSAVDMGPDGVSVVQRGQHDRVMRVSMGYRFFLANGLTPGAYPWPLQLSVAPLVQDRNGQDRDDLAQYDTVMVMVSE